MYNLALLQFSCTIHSFSSRYPDNRSILQCFPSTATEKLLVTTVEHKLEEAMLEGTRLNLWEFISINVPIPHSYPSLTTLYSFRFDGLRFLARNYTRLRIVDSRIDCSPVPRMQDN